jgi:hypothetical protein
MVVKNNKLKMSDLILNGFFIELDITCLSLLSGNYKLPDVQSGITNAAQQRYAAQQCYAAQPWVT